MHTFNQLLFLSPGHPHLLVAGGSSHVYKQVGRVRGVGCLLSRAVVPGKFNVFRTNNSSTVKYNLSLFALTIALGFMMILGFLALLSLRP